MFIDAIEKKDKSKVKRYWRNYLETKDEERKEELYQAYLILSTRFLRVYRKDWQV